MYQTQKSTGILVFARGKFLYGRLLLDANGFLSAWFQIFSRFNARFTAVADSTFAKFRKRHFSFCGVATFKISGKGWQCESSRLFET